MSWIRFGSPSSYVTANAATDLWTAPSAHGLVAGQAIFFYDVTDPTGAGVNMPSPLINATTYYVAAAGLTTTQFKVSYTSGGSPVDLLTNSGSPGLWLFYDSVATGGPNYAPNFKTIPCVNGAGVTVNVINAGIRGRHIIPQPFLSYLERITLTETWFPDGYVGHIYTLTQNFDGTPIVSIVAGALPPGLALSVTGNALTITGTPTTVGAYDFTMRLQSGLVAADYLNHITIYADPDEGVGAVGGG